jgi:hypothetical protein
VSFNAKINVLIVAFFAIGIKTNAPGSFIVLVLTVVISVSSGLLSVHLMWFCCTIWIMVFSASCLRWQIII